MGQVTFNGNVATAESQVWIRQEEQRILLQPGKDRFQLAREVEQLYRFNSLEPGSFIRAGSQDVIRNGGGGVSLPSVGPVRWLLAFALVLFAVAWMNNFGFHTAKENAVSDWRQCEIDRGHGRLPPGTECVRPEK